MKRGSYLNNQSSLENFFHFGGHISLIGFLSIKENLNFLIPMVNAFIGKITFRV